MFDVMAGSGFVVLILLPLFLLVLLFLASWGARPPGFYSEPFQQTAPTQTVTHAGEHSNHLKILSWNIAYAYGLGSSGSKGYYRKSKQTFVDHLNGIATFIRDSKPDLVLLQEVDFGSRRSHFVDQLEWIQKESGFAFSAPAVAWKANYVPYPYFPITHHYGKMLSGGAVLSRFPISLNEVMIHHLPRNNPWWYNRFYIRRFSQKVCIRTHQGEFCLINNHLDAFEKENRVTQARNLANWIQSGRHQNLIAYGGDFNSVPSLAKKKSRFQDEERDDYESDSTIKILSGVQGFDDALPEKSYLADESQFFTFPSDSPTRKLDYLFINREWSVERFEILKGAGTLSDHLPIFAELNVNSLAPKQ